MLNRMLILFSPMLFWYIKTYSYLGNLWIQPMSMRYDNKSLSSEWVRRSRIHVNNVAPVWSIAWPVVTINNCYSWQRPQLQYCIICLLVCWFYFDNAVSWWSFGCSSWCCCCCCCCCWNIALSRRNFISRSKRFCISCFNFCRSVFVLKYAWQELTSIVIVG